MKKYDVDEIVERHRQDIDDGQWVPADVAQGLYDQLMHVYRVAKMNERGEELPDDQDGEEWLIETGKALSAADGEDV